MNGPLGCALSADTRLVRIWGCSPPSLEKCCLTAVLAKAHCSLHNAELRAERLLQSLVELEIETGKGKIQITVSIGLASLSSGDSGASWLARADAALYEAKSAGRNCVRVARETGSAVASLVPPRSLVPGPRSSQSP